MLGTERRIIPGSWDPVATPIKPHHNQEVDGDFYFYQWEMLCHMVSEQY